MRLKGLPGLAFGCSLIGLLGLAWLVYCPGLKGTFLFDDFANLPNLGTFGTIDSAARFWRYVTSGSADPTGRPLALLSFLIDANDWPAAPYPFKRTSVLLHLLNGALLCWLLLKLGRTLGAREGRAKAAALLGSAFWLLHPLFVSTTLYVVQREAMLPTSFILLGLLGYCVGRELAARGRSIGVFLAAVSICGCTILAFLSKANGALLPLLAWIVDGIVLAPAQPISHTRTQRTFANIRRLVLIAPSLLLFAFLAKVAYRGFSDGLPAIRPWTLGERLLTEARVLVDYLGLLWWPRPYTAGLFNDAFKASTGLLSPSSTSWCLLAIIALLACAWNLRRRHPAFAVAVLFFFAGQLMESTVVPLELYYEHRNYAPALLIFWPLALWLSNGSSIQRTRVASSPKPGVKPWLRHSLAIILILGLAGMTFMGADLWGNVSDQALLWALKNPESPRAQAYAAQVELERGQVAQAITRLEKALAGNPDEIQLSLNMVGAKCRARTLTAEDLERAAMALRNAANTGRLGYDWFDRSLAIAQNGSCPGLNLDALDRLLVAAGENARTRNIPGRIQDRLHLQGRIALLRGDAEQAFVLFNAALDADPRPEAALEQAAMLATVSRPDLAERHLDHLADVWQPPSAPGWSMPSIHAWLLWNQGYWTGELTRLRKLLAEDIAARKSDPNAKSVPTVKPEIE